jgi:hypothetical protein
MSWASTPSFSVADAADTAAGDSSALDDALSCATNSFTGDTKVLLASGALVAISQIKVGDKVEATDPTTGKTVAATVSRLFMNDDHNLANVTVRVADGSLATLDGTQGHRFWDATQHAWVVESHLRAGDELLSANGSPVQVVSVLSSQGSQWMYDLTVDAVHTFYVLAGSAPVLVHNCNPLDGVQYSSKAEAQMQGDPGEFHSFPSVVDNYATNDMVMQGADGATHIQIPGSYLSSGGNWYDGYFHYIIDNGEITHRLFEVP